MNIEKDNTEREAPKAGRMQSKTFAGIVKANTVDIEKHTVEVVMSDETLDRYDEVVMADGWDLKDYKKHPVLLSSHRYNGLMSQIGKALSVKVIDGELVAKLKYFVDEGNEEADWAWKLVSKFGIAAFSVGFSPDDWVYRGDERYDAILTQWQASGKGRKKQTPRLFFTKQSLLENSQVLVPANPSGLMKGMESKEDAIRDMSTKMKSFVDKGELTVEGSETIPEPFVAKELSASFKSVEDMVKLSLEKEENDVDLEVEGILDVVDKDANPISGDDEDKNLHDDEGVEEKTVEKDGDLDDCSITLDADTLCITKDEEFFDDKDNLIKFLDSEHCELKAVVPYRKFELMNEDDNWSAAAARGRMAAWAGYDGDDKETIDWSKYRRGFTWYDSEAETNFGSYKLPHHDVDGGALKTNWHGVRSAMGVLLGAMGGVAVPDSERKGIYNHLKRHYAEFGKDVPEFKDYDEEESILKACGYEVAEPEAAMTLEGAIEAIKGFKSAIESLTEKVELLEDGVVEKEIDAHDEKDSQDAIETILLGVKDLTKGIIEGKEEKGLLEAIRDLTSGVSKTGAK